MIGHNSVRSACKLNCFTKLLRGNIGLNIFSGKTNVNSISSTVKQKNHYEILKVSKDCSSKEIRDAFISLSKQYHPDMNKSNPKAQEQFVKINEAYNVLIKPQSRRDYDSSLQYGAYGAHRPDYYQVYRRDPQYRDPWKDPSFARNQKFWNENSKQNEDYYGVKGIKKVSNQQFFFWILVLAGVGLFIQIAIIRFSGVRNFAALDKRTRDNQQHLDAVRQRAESFGSRDSQIEEYQRRLNKSNKD